MFQKIKNNVGQEPLMWCRRTLDWESALWSEDLTGLELGSCSWVLKKFNPKPMICWCSISCQYNSVMWCKNESSKIYLFIHDLLLNVLHGRVVSSLFNKWVVLVWAQAPATVGSMHWPRVYHDRGCKWNHHLL